MHCCVFNKDPYRLYSHNGAKQSTSLKNARRVKFRVGVVDRRSMLVRKTDVKRITSGTNEEDERVQSQQVISNLQKQDICRVQRLFYIPIISINMTTKCFSKFIRFKQCLLYNFLYLLCFTTFDILVYASKSAIIIKIYS